MGMYEVSSRDGEHVPGLIGVMVAQLLTVLKTTELYTLNRYVVWCVNYISIKLEGKKSNQIIST